MKNKLSIAILLLLCSIHSFSQKKEKHIVWSKDRLLTWEDFQKRPPRKTIHGGICVSKISFDFLKTQGELEVKAVFIVRESWVIERHKSVRALKHEQGHFDITEIYARMLRKELLEYKRFTLKNYRKKCIRINNKIYKKCNYEQKLYDKETNHHLNKEKQEEWNRKTAERLNELEEYSEPVIQIKLRGNG